MNEREAKPFASLDEVRECVLRFIHSHFRDPNKPHAIISIPADLGWDDDLRLMDHVERQWKRIEELELLLASGAAVAQNA